MNRYNLIDRFTAWLKTNPTLNIGAIQCANIAEEAYAESMVLVIEDQSITIGTVIERNFGEGNIYNCTFEVRGIVDELIIVCKENGGYENIHKSVMRMGFREGDFTIKSNKILTEITPEKTWTTEEMLAEMYRFCTSSDHSKLVTDYYCSNDDIKKAITGWGERNYNNLKEE